MNGTAWLAVLGLVATVWLPTVDLRILSGVVTAAAIQLLVNKGEQR